MGVLLIAAGLLVREVGEIAYGFAELMAEGSAASSPGSQKVRKAADNALNMMSASIQRKATP
jgi:hypothetical protein